MMLTDEAAERFFRGRKKLKQFKESINCTNEKIVSKTGINRSAIINLFGKADIKPTSYNQRNLDILVNLFHLNKGWIYGDSKKMLNDTKALTFTEVCMLALDSKDKRMDCTQRFEEARTADNVTDKELAKLVGVSESTVPQWIARAAKAPKYIEMMLKYCQKHCVNPRWLFYGEGNLRTDEIWSFDDGLEKPKKKKRWYIVNKTYLIVNQGWWIDPEGFRIVEAYRKQEVSKDYPIEYVEVDGKNEMKLTTERAIAVFNHKQSAVEALRAELARIKAEGNLVVKAKWSSEVVR